MSEILEQEISYSKVLLREICEKFGDLEWTDEMSIPEILSEHLTPYLEKTALKGKRVIDHISDAKNLIKVWQLCLNKSKSNPGDRYVKMIADRLADGYSVGQMVQAIVGLSKSQHHLDGGFTHVTYFARSGNQVDIMIHKAEQAGSTEEKCKARYDLFLSDPEEFYKSKKEKGYVNPRTGGSLK